MNDLSEHVPSLDGYLELQADAENFLDSFQRNLEAYIPIVVHNQSYLHSNVYSFGFMQKTYGLLNPGYFSCNSK